MKQVGVIARCNAAAGSCMGELAAAIDLDHLSRYTLGNHKLQREVLALFRTQSDVYLQCLEEALDAKAWADAAHTLKGSARTVGAMDVARCAEAAEQLSRAPCSADHQTVLRELTHSLARANQCIDLILGGIPTDV